MRLSFLMFGLVLVFCSPAYAATDGEIRQLLIQQSLAGYPGPCPCPYNTMRNGRSCGGRSAYSKPSGYEPLCYPKDVTDAMVAQYRASHPD